MPYTNVPEVLWGKMDSCVQQVMRQGHAKPAAIAICYSSLVGKKVLVTNYPITDRPIGDLLPAQGEKVALDWKAVQQQPSAWAAPLLAARQQALQCPCAVQDCLQPATRLLTVSGERLAYCDAHLSGAKELLAKHRLAISDDEPVICQVVGEKEGRFITKDNRVIFIGGPSAGGGGTTGSVPFGRAATSGKIADSKDLGGGVTEASIVTYEDDGDGVFKDMHAARGVHDGNSEVAAYRINQLLGGDEVPETVFTFMGDRIGTAQQFVTGAILGEETSILAIQQSDRQALDRIIAMDAIIGNHDRHPGNFLYKDGKVIAIDHGHANWNRLDNSDPFKSPLAFNQVARAVQFSSPGLAATDTVGMMDWEVNSTWTFSPQSLAAWRGITREQWDAALADVNGERRVNKNNGWENLQTILRDGYVLGGRY